jgi:hypothetical protein
MSAYLSLSTFRAGDGIGGAGTGSRAIASSLPASFAITTTFCMVTRTGIVAQAVRLEDRVRHIGLAGFLLQQDEGLDGIR